MTMYRKTQLSAAPGRRRETGEGFWWVKSERRVEGLDGFASQLGAGVGGRRFAGVTDPREAYTACPRHTHTHTEKVRESERQIEM